MIDPRQPEQIAKILDDLIIAFWEYRMQCDDEYTQAPYKHRIMIDKAKEIRDRIRSRPHSIPPAAPDFANAEINDWIEGVGDITTEYEKNFIRRYGQREATIRNDELQRALDIINSGKSSLYEIMPDGHWTPVLQAKFDVLLWVEESLRTQEQLR